MPIVRMNEKGQKIPDNAEILLKENLEKAAAKSRHIRTVSGLTLAGSLASVALFYFASPDIGILCAVLSSSVSTILNLYAD